MAPRKRKAETPGVGRAGKAARAGSSNSMPSKRNSGDIPIVDLSCVDDAAQYEALKKRQQDEAIRAQNEADAKRPAKLAEFQCIICMDNPTDLTVTHCGMFIPPAGHGGANVGQVTSSARNVYIKHFTLETRSVVLCAERRSVCHDQVRSKGRMAYFRWK